MPGHHVFVSHIRDIRFASFTLDFGVFSVSDVTMSQVVAQVVSLLSKVLKTKSHQTETYKKTDSSNVMHLAAAAAAATADLKALMAHVVSRAERDMAMMAHAKTAIFDTMKLYADACDDLMTTINNVAMAAFARAATDNDVLVVSKSKHAIRRSEEKVEAAARKVNAAVAAHKSMIAKTKTRAAIWAAAGKSIKSQDAAIAKVQAKAASSGSSRAAMKSQEKQLTLIRSQVTIMLKAIAAVNQLDGQDNDCDIHPIQGFRTTTNVLFEPYAVI